MSNDIVLEYQDVSVFIENKKVVKNINLNVYQGEILYLIGPNGGGKTSLIKAALGLLPYSGKIKIFGKPREKLSKEELLKISYVPQIKSIDREFPITVKELVEMSTKNKRAVEKAISLLGLEKKKNSQIRALSGGELQRAFIARALANSPELVFLDEPETALDKTWRKKLLSVIERYAKNGTSFLISTHDTFVVKRETQRIACVNRDVFVHGEVKDVLTQQNLEKLYSCPVELFFHAEIPHRVVEVHKKRRR